MESLTPTGELFIELMEPTVLYNLLNQTFEYPSISDPTYLLLIDARKLHEYNESHIVTAKHAPKDAHDQYEVPYDGELECKQSIVVYDGTTDSLTNIDGEAMKCAQLLADNGSRNTVKVLSGGYERFSALYPFLRTQKILWLPQELDHINTYPIEVIPGLLYLGTKQQALADSTKKDLKIQGQVVCYTNGEGQVADSVTVADNEMRIQPRVKEQLMEACSFIDKYKDKKSVVLVYSEERNGAASMMCAAYLMYAKNISMRESASILHTQCYGTASDVENFHL